MYDFDLLLKDSYTNIPEEDFLNTIAPLHENLSNGNEQWQHIIPQSSRRSVHALPKDCYLLSTNQLPKPHYDFSRGSGGPL